jgi:MarR family 2-MHQ and catechol resistance regulon transcriptional repressor
MSTTEDTAAISHQPPCGIDDPRIHTFGLLLEAHAQLTRLLDADLQDSDGISLQTFEVLLRISRAEEGRITMSGLAGGVALTTGGVTRLADRLEKDGLVQRVSCPSDRRVVYLTLTDQGRATLAEALTHHLDSLERRVASRISPRDTATLNRVLDDLRRADD